MVAGPISIEDVLDPLVRRAADRTRSAPCAVGTSGSNLWFAARAHLAFVEHAEPFNR